jgi:hypothetical protein
VIRQLDCDNRREHARKRAGRASPVRSGLDRAREPKAIPEVGSELIGQRADDGDVSEERSSTG